MTNLVKITEIISKIRNALVLAGHETLFKVERALGIPQRVAEAPHLSGAVQRLDEITQGLHNAPYEVLEEVHGLVGHLVPEVSSPGIAAGVEEVAKASAEGTPQSETITSQDGYIATGDGPQVQVLPAPQDQHEASESHND